MPLLRREADEVNDVVYAGMTLHAAYEPQRAVRTARYKYIRRFDEDHVVPVLPNVDDSATKDLLMASGWAERPIPAEPLYDLVSDSDEAANVADEPAYAGVLTVLRERLQRRMADTEDPLLDEPVAPPPGTEHNDPAQRSADDLVLVVPAV